MFDSNRGWTGTPIEMSVGQSYDVYFNKECTYTRYNAVRAEAEKTPITLTTGWTRIGYTPADELTVDDALQDYTPAQNDVIKDYDGFAIYDGGTWKGTMTTMAPGVGYKYYTPTPDTFHYSGEGDPAALARRRVFSYEDYLDPQPLKGEYPDNMTMIAEVRRADGSVLPSTANYKVLAFVGDECRGVGQYVDTSHVFFTIYGTEATAAASIVGKHRASATPESVRFEVVSPELNMWSVVKNEDFSVTPQGTMADPIVLNMPDDVTTGTGNVSDNLKMYSARPNPVQTTLYLIGLTDRIHAWTLVDMSGRTVAKGNGYDDAEGIDVSRHADGHYILVLDTDFGHQTVQLIKN